MPPALDPKRVNVQRVREIRERAGVPLQTARRMAVREAYEFDLNRAENIDDLRRVLLDMVAEILPKTPEGI